MGLQVHGFWHLSVAKFHRKRRRNNKAFSRHNELKILFWWVSSKSPGFFVKPWKVIVGDTILSILTFLPFDQPISHGRKNQRTPIDCCFRHLLRCWLQARLLSGQPGWIGSNVKFFDGKFSDVFMEPQRRWCFQNVNGWIGERDFETKLRAAGSDLFCFFLWPAVCFSRCLCLAVNWTKHPLPLSGRMHHDLSEPVCVFDFNH